MPLAFLRRQATDVANYKGTGSDTQVVSDLLAIALERLRHRGLDAVVHATHA